ncbi:transporter substrate-binding domain-containing protein [soil metagenome]
MRLWLLLLIVVWMGCKPYPKDPENSLQEIENGVLHVGISHNPPYTVVNDTGVSGIEVALVQKYAAQHHAHIKWVNGTETALMRKLESFELDIAIGGFVKESPTVNSLGITQSFLSGPGGKHVIVVAPGENALLSDLDGFLVSNPLK